MNASEALGDQDGVITIATGVRERSRECLDTFLGDAGLPPGRYLTLEVTDTGCGMDSETKVRLFEPFYSTKFVGRGLGLAAVQGIVYGHRGALRVESAEGRGSTFALLFPAEDERARPAPSRVAPAEEWRGRGTALLVDDEETIRTVGRRMLERVGFQVLTAEDGGQALEVYRLHGAEISVVLLDLTMPHMDGEQTFRELRSLDPEACVILSSGYTEQDTADRFRDLGLAGFVQKPYTLEQLRERLRTALGADTVPEDSAGR